MTQTPTHSVAWFELPVRDLDRAIAFYNAVFQTGLVLESGGPNPMAMFPTQGGAEGPGVSGHLYPGTPAADGRGPTVHLNVPGRIEEAIERCIGAGGRMVGPVIEIPPGRFAYAIDLDGNSIGLFERKAA